TQGSSRNCLHSRCSCSSGRRAIVRFLWIAVRQNWAKANNDGGKSPCCARLRPDLSRDESVFESHECSDVDASGVRAGDFRDDGVWANRRISCRGVSGTHPIHVVVASVSFWKWVVRRISSAYLDVDRRTDGEYLRRTRISDHCCSVDLRRRIVVPERESHTSNLGRGRRSQSKRRVSFRKTLRMAAAYASVIATGYQLPATGGAQQAAGSREPVAALRDSIAARIAAFPGATVGVAYEDFATTETLSLNADTAMHAASTMKIPVMIEVLRRAQQGSF